MKRTKVVTVTQVKAVTGFASRTVVRSTVTYTRAADGTVTVLSTSTVPARRRMLKWE